MQFFRSKVILNGLYYEFQKKSKGWGKSPFSAQARIQTTIKDNLNKFFSFWITFWLCFFNEISFLDNCNKFLVFSFLVF